MRKTFALIVAVAVMSAACGGPAPDGSTNNVSPTGPSSTTGTSSSSSGQLAFSTTASKGWSTIDIWVDGQYVGTLSHYFTSQSQSASCVAVTNARVVTSVASGNRSYNARSNLGATWSGTMNVSSGGCSEVVLTCTNGDCSR